MTFMVGTCTLLVEGGVLVVCWGLLLLGRAYRRTSLNRV